MNGPERSNELQRSNETVGADETMRLARRADSPSRGFVDALMSVSFSEDCKAERACLRRRLQSGALCYSASSRTARARTRPPDLGTSRSRSAIEARPSTNSARPSADRASGRNGRETHHAKCGGKQRPRGEPNPNETSRIRVARTARSRPGMLRRLRSSSHSCRASSRTVS